MRIRSNVLEGPAAASAEAAGHFRNRLMFETDCSDVGADIAAGVEGFTVIDCRSLELYEAGHVPGAISLPHRRITAESLRNLAIDPQTTIVTYCNGPHCNASTRGALRLSELGWSVKEMPGGMDGWIREHLPVEYGMPEAAAAGPRSRMSVTAT